MTGQTNVCSIELMGRLRMTKQCALKDLIELMKIEEKIKKAHEQSTLKKIRTFANSKNRELIKKALAK